MVKGLWGQSRAALIRFKMYNVTNFKKQQISNRFSKEFKTSLKTNQVTGFNLNKIGALKFSNNFNLKVSFLNLKFR